MPLRMQNEELWQAAIKTALSGDTSYKAASSPTGESLDKKAYLKGGGIVGCTRLPLGGAPRSGEGVARRALRGAHFKYPCAASKILHS